MEVLTSRQTYDPHPEDAWKRLKLRLRKPQELAVVQAVAAWREREARERNIPRGRVLKDDAIYEIAQQAAARRGGARHGCAPRPRAGSAPRRRRRCLSWSMRRSDMPKESMPKLPKHAADPGRHRALPPSFSRCCCRLVAEAEGVAAKVLASSDDIDRLAADGETADVPALHGWRREVFGERALQLVRGEIAIKFERRKITVFETPKEPAEA